MSNYWLVERWNLPPISYNHWSLWDDGKRRIEKIICGGDFRCWGNSGRVNYVFRQWMKKNRLLQIALNSLLNYFSSYSFGWCNVYSCFYTNTNCLSSIFIARSFFCFCKFDFFLLTMEEYEKWERKLKKFSLCLLIITIW
jgi:hypothetical protein